ncbi:MAG: trypsin-like peptidase domain-containing protein [candidate division WOR-3 bacterium]|nr:trypsin-like peptidase domain-containing protein [candidate division WOR-3 bacterium]
MKSTLALILLATGAAFAQVSFVSAADAVRPSLVSIITDKVGPAGAADSNGPALTQTAALGSGFVLDTLGHILTCNHVVANYDGVTVRFSDDKAYGGRKVVVVGLDPVTDLAVIQVKAKREFVPVALGNSDELEVGQPVMAMGSPFGLEGTATAGIVSALSRWGQPKSSGPDFQDFIQTDALVNPGNSGGPLVDVRGRVVGVSSFIRTTRTGPTGIGFATPINLARSVSDQLIRNGRVIRGFLGISTQPITEGIRQALGLRSRDGVLVSSIDPGQPGARAGILPGDAIVTLDGKAIPDARWFQSEVAGRPPGSSVKLALLRKGAPLSVVVTLGAWPTVAASPAQAPEPGTWLGLTVRSLTGTDRSRTGLDSGVGVEAVETGGAAARAGIHAGDVIPEINLAPVRSLTDFGQIEKTMTGSGRPLLLRVFRGRQVFYTTVEP